MLNWSWFLKHKFSMTKFSLVNKGEYVKGERKGRKSIMKSKRIFPPKKERYIQKGQQKKKETWEKQMFKKEIKKGECPKNTREDTQKKEKLKKTKKRQREGRTCKNIQICEYV